MGGEGKISLSVGGLLYALEAVDYDQYSPEELKKVVEGIRRKALYLEARYELVVVKEA